MSPAVGQFSADHARASASGYSVDRKRPSWISARSTAEVALHAPALAAGVGQLAAGREAQLAAAAADDRLVRRRQPHHQVDAVELGGHVARPRDARVRRLLGVERIDHRRALRRAERELGRRAARRAGRATSKSANATVEPDPLLHRRLRVVGARRSPRTARGTASGPPAACISRSIWRSAAAIEVTCACGPVACATRRRCRAARTAGSRTGRSRPGRRRRSRCAGRAIAGHARAGRGSRSCGRRTGRRRTAPAGRRSCAGTASR